MREGFKSQYALILYKRTLKLFIKSFSLFKARSYWEIWRLQRPSWGSAIMPTGGAVIPKEDGRTWSKCGETGQCIIRGLYYPSYILLGRIWYLSNVPLSPLPCKEQHFEVSKFFIKNVNKTLLLLCWVALANVLCTSYWPLWIVKASVAIETWPKIVGTVLGFLVGNDGKIKVKSSFFCLESGN